MRRALLLHLFLVACVTQPAPAPQQWQLVSIDGHPFAARATLTIDAAAGRAFGQGPCNRWTGQIETEPFPRWRLRKVAATMIACDTLAEEQAFFAALQQMTRSSMGAGHLALTNEAGREMRFVPATP